MIRLGRAEPYAIPPMRLEGTRVVLRPPTENDWKEWAQLRHESRAFLTPWEPLWPVDALSEKVYERRLRRYACDWRDDEGYTFHVFDRQSNDLVGGIGLTHIKRGVAQSGVIGYWAGERFAGQGYISEATHLVIHFAFEKLQLNRVEATCIPDNFRSQKLLEKAGFTREGYARDYLKIAGEWADHFIYGLLKKDWSARRQKL